MKNASKLALAAIFVILLIALLSINVVAYTSPGCLNANAVPEGNVDEHYEYFARDDVSCISEASSYSNINSSVSANAGIKLTALEKSIYNELKSKIASVANGTLTSTKFSITADLSSLSWTKEELGCAILSGGSISEDAKIAFKEKLNETIDFNYIIGCLLADCPYELFWYDKTIGWSYNYTFRGNTSRAYITSLTLSLVVSDDYRSGSASDYKTDSTKISAANTALTNAKTIVEKHSDKPSF